MQEYDLHDLCKQLRISRTLADRALTLGADNQREFLAELFAAEIGDRKSKRCDGLLKSAGFYNIKTADGFIEDDVQFPPGGSKDELMNLDFMREKWNVVMYGGTGTGKTLLSTAIGVAACRKGIPVKFYRTATLVNALSEAKSAGTLSKLLDAINKAEILILDEWGYVPVDTTGAQLLFDIISERYEQKSIILNTNLEFSHWVNILYDPKLTAALIARMLHHCHLLIFSGPDMRLKESSINNLYSKIAEDAIRAAETKGKETTK